MLTHLALLILPLAFVFGMLIFVRSMVRRGVIGEKHKTWLLITSVVFTCVSLAISIPLLLKR